MTSDRRRIPFNREEESRNKKRQEETISCCNNGDTSRKAISKKSLHFPKINKRRNRHTNEMQHIPVSRRSIQKKPYRTLKQ